MNLRGVGSRPYASPEPFRALSDYSPDASVLTLCDYFSGPPVKLQFRAIAIVQQRCASSECALAVFYKRRRAKERH